MMTAQASGSPRSSTPLRIGIGGPVGSGKTTLCEMLLKAMRDRYSMAVRTAAPVGRVTRFEYRSHTVPRSTVPTSMSSVMDRS